MEMKKVSQGQVWEHKNGNQYRVMFLTNTAHITEKHPIQVVYKGVTNDHVWSRPLDEWHTKMTYVHNNPDHSERDE